MLQYEKLPHHLYKGKCRKIILQSKKIFFLKIIATFAADIGVRTCFHRGG